MPHFKVKVKDVVENQTQTVSVWAENSRQANVAAVKVARLMLGHDQIDLLQTKALDGRLYK